MTGNDLRERRRLATQAEIEAVALELFSERGSERTTVEDIAAAAGVSQRTFFRYFPTKEDAALGVNRSFQEAFTAELARGRNVFEAVEATLAAVRTRDGAVDRLLRVRCLLARDDNLNRAAVAFDSQACHANQELMGGGLRARVVMETVSAALRAALDDWALRRHDGEDADLLEIFREACRYTNLSTD
ncbi:TetR family transcriptional regulator [Actinoplanes sp. NPDC048796]|uniref:TetR family transcriptional regulator n=1 Tax=unclassified Actinoplanes TaxID=2626549 RepID=UPI0033CC6DFA